MMHKHNVPANIQAWLRILQELPLNKAEREVVQRFASEPEGRGFLSVAEILKNHGASDEGVELLTEGLHKHPDLSVARVILARELLSRGMIDQSLKTLEEAPKPLKDNLLAQKITLKCAVILGQEPKARALIVQLKGTHHLDEETRYLVKTFESLGPLGLRDRLVEDFAQGGVYLDPSLYPKPQPDVLPYGRHSDELPSPKDTPSNWVGKRRKGMRSLKRPHELFAAGLISQFYNAEDIEAEPRVQGFQAVPLGEVFYPDQQVSKDHDPRSMKVPQSLDSMTLAEIYMKQGHYQMALDVYKRLLRITPGHDLIKRRIAELTRLEKEQKADDMTIDPAVVDRMEQVSEIDRKVKFLQEIMKKLNHRAS